MRILFLDIDGVLNGDGSFDEEALSSTIDPRCVRNLNSVFHRVPDCSVVLSSSWRTMVNGGGPGSERWFGPPMPLKSFEFLLRSHGIHVVDRLIACTPSSDAVLGRANQIMHVVRDLKPIRWCAVDDQPLVLDNFVRTHASTGMTSLDANEIVERLK